MKITKKYLRKIIFEEVKNIQEIGKSGRPYFEDPQGQKKWKKRQAHLAKARWDDDDEDPDELDMLGMQFGLDDDDPRMAWAREMEEGKDPYEHALESPLAEDDFNLEQIDEVATKLHDLVMWAMEHGYKPKR